jgi:L-lactate dehydrogenase complex protein LldG
MGAIADSRELVLERIRAATRNAAPAERRGAHENAVSVKDYIHRGAMEPEARRERMAERLREYDAEVVECRPEGLAAAIEEQLAASGRRTFVAPEGIPKDWLAPGFDWKIDAAGGGGLTVEAIERAEGVVTACFCGVAESGTIVLHHGAMEGRRVLSLLPDWHLCIVRSSQIVETLPEYFDKCREQESRERATPDGSEGARELPRLVTWIAGPSATADIEMTRIKGVHGPRFLNVILVRD